MVIAKNDLDKLFMTKFICIIKVALWLLSIAGCVKTIEIMGTSQLPKVECSNKDKSLLATIHKYNTLSYNIS